MENDDLLQGYSNSIRRLKQQCNDAGMSEDEFRKMYFESLKSLEHHQPQVYRRPRFKYKFIIMSAIILVCAAYNYKIIYSSLICNLQEFIYPGLKILRRIAIPFISLFPSLTELYHETCLVQNPFFTVVDMDCWPCSTINNVREVNDPKPGHQYKAPFMYETKQQVVTLTSIQDLYIKNKGTLEKESPKVLLNNKHHISLEDMFNRENWKGDGNSGNFYVWTFNNMNAARLLRQIIPRPAVVPKFGQSTERFIVFDFSQSMFPIPDTECNFSFLLALSGSRTIHLMPAEECKHQCKMLKLELNETYLLWYNWWYWRPVIQPSTGNTTFVAHIGSYC